MKKFALIASLAVLATFGAAASANAEDAESQPTEAGVRAVEAHWQKAFITGDTAYLEQLLVPTYVSVSTDGTPRDRETIEKLSAAFAKRSATQAPAVAQRSQDAITIEGTTAIVTSFSPSYHQRSVDVFFYGDGTWHALYSQHTTVAG
jgi:hypothetical protein